MPCEAMASRTSVMSASYSMRWHVHEKHGAEQVLQMREARVVVLQDKVRVADAPRLNRFQHAVLSMLSINLRGELSRQQVFRRERWSNAARSNALPLLTAQAAMAEAGKVKEEGAPTGALPVRNAGV